MKTNINEMAEKSKSINERCMSDCLQEALAQKYIEQTNNVRVTRNTRIDGAVLCRVMVLVSESCSLERVVEVAKTLDE